MEFPFLLYALSIPGPGEWENPKDEDPRELKSEIVNWGLRLKAVEPPLCVLMKKELPGTCPKGLFESLDEEIRRQCLTQYLATIIAQ